MKNVNGKLMFNKDRPLSWSAISSFWYDPEQWYRKYVLGQKDPESKEMLFGKTIGKRLETDPSYLPMVVRHSKMEHEFKVKFGKIPLVGYADSFCVDSYRKLAEYKTGKKAWDQKRVDGHGQIDMYLLMNYITKKVKPEEVAVSLVWLPTCENENFDICFVDPIEENVKIFNTKRTMADILRFGKKLTNTYKEMEQYCLNHD